MTDSLCDLHMQRASTNTDPRRACRPRPQLKPPETWPWTSLTRKFSSVVSAKPLCVCQQEIENFPVSDIARVKKKNKKQHRSKYSLLEVIWWNTFTRVHGANFGPMQNCKLKGDMCEQAERRGRTLGLVGSSGNSCFKAQRSGLRRALGPTDLHTGIFI